MSSSGRRTARHPAARLACDAFTALEAQIPQLFTRKTPADTARVWVPACATAAEAYSIAMLSVSMHRPLEGPPALQIFATDLDDEVIAITRRGCYPATIASRGFRLVIRLTKSAAKLQNLSDAVQPESAKRAS